MNTGVRIPVGTPSYENAAPSEVAAFLLAPEARLQVRTPQGFVERSATGRAHARIPRPRDEAAEPIPVAISRRDGTEFQEHESYAAKDQDVSEVSTRRRTLPAQVAQYPARSTSPCDSLSLWSIIRTAVMQWLHHTFSRMAF